MFEMNQVGTFEHLSATARDELLQLLDKRRTLNLHLATMADMQIRVIGDPSEEASEALRRFSAEIVQPLRESMAPHMARLVAEAIDTDKLQAMLPMALMALSQSIDLELLCATLGIDPDVIEKMIDAAHNFFKRGMQ